MTPEKITIGYIQQTGEVVDPMWEYLLLYFEQEETTHFEGFVDSLPKGLQFVYYFYVFDGDVLNGGIRQFFYNHSRSEVQKTLLLMESIGATESADLIKRAMGVYDRMIENWKRNPQNQNQEQPWNDARYFDSINIDSQALDAIDAARCNLESSHRDYELLNAYAHQHPEQFVHDGLHSKS